MFKPRLVLPLAGEWRFRRHHFTRQVVLRNFWQSKPSGTSCQGLGSFDPFATWKYWSMGQRDPLERGGGGGCGVGPGVGGNKSRDLFFYINDGSRGSWPLSPDALRVVCSCHVMCQHNRTKWLAVAVVGPVKGAQSLSLSPSIYLSLYLSMYLSARSTGTDSRHRFLPPPPPLSRNRFRK